MKNSYLIVCSFIAFFPWVSFGLNSYDTQPWFLIATLPFLLIYGFNFKNLINIYLLYFLLIAFILAIMSVNESHEFLFRTFGTYLSLVCSVIFFERYTKLKQSLRIRLIIIANGIWFFYAILEHFQFDGLPVFSNSRTSEDRGVSALSVEPTFYGIFSIFQIIIGILELNIFKNNTGKMHKGLVLICIVNIVQILFIAKSSLAILILLLISLVWIIIFRPVIFTTYVMMPFLIISIIVLSTISDITVNSRPLLMLQELIYDPGGIIYSDMSIAERFSAIFISINGSIDNAFIPHGFDEYNIIAKEMLERYNWLQSYETNIIMSLIGGVLFEFGFFALPIIFYPLFILYRESLKIKIFWFSLFFIIFINAIPVGFPLIGYLLSLFKITYTENNNRKLQADSWRKCN